MNKMLTNNINRNTFQCKCNLLLKNATATEKKKWKRVDIWKPIVLLKIEIYILFSPTNSNISDILSGVNWGTRLSYLVCAKFVCADHCSEKFPVPEYCPIGGWKL